LIALADNLTPSERGRRMGLVRSTGSQAEWLVRRLAHGLGYRYRLHRRDLPGTPDLVFASRRKVVFVHGCFWHGHANCKLSRLPKSRVAFWKEKFAANKRRDKRASSMLRALGWRSLVIWECELRDIDRVALRLIVFLEDD
jgi:DNA mismatch endonuclease, patch repair protein